MAIDFRQWLAKGGGGGQFFGVSPTASDSFASTAATGSPGGVQAQPATNTSGSPTSVDFGSLINNDFGVNQQRAENQAGSIGDAAGRAAALRRAVIELGVVPDFDKAGKALGLDSLGYLQSDIDDRTRGLAEKNTSEGLSLVARLNQEHSRLQRQVGDALAARGIYRSGETGFQMGEESLRHKQAMTDAEKAVLDHMSQIIGSFVSNENDRKRLLSQAMGAAGDRNSMNQFLATLFGQGGATTSQAPGAPAPAAPAPDPFEDFVKYGGGGGGTSWIKSY